MKKKHKYNTIINQLLKPYQITLEEIHEEYKPKLVRYIRLNEEYSNENKLVSLLDSLKGAKQKEVLMHYFQLHAVEKKPISVKHLTETAQTSAAIIKALIDKNIFEEYYLQHDRVNFDSNKTASNLQLSETQSKAYSEIIESFNTKEVSLLHGITSSGKTEIYTKLIEDYLAQGKQVLYLLPEIALTTQLVSRLTQHFGNEVAVFHSKYNSNERVEVYNHVLQNSEKAKVVLGVRSALFLPFSNLGLIVVDEEHEATYKQQDPAPRYHARDAAIVLAKFHNAKVLLGSATPSLESYQNAKTNKYGLIEMFTRFNNVVLPEIHLIDLKDKYFRKRMDGHFSDELLERMNETLANKDQIMLFQNRRGYSPYIECTT